MSKKNPEKTEKKAQSAKNKRKFTLSTLIYDDKYLRIVVVVLALLIWYTVVSLVKDEGRFLISHVQLDVENQMSAIYASLG